MKSWEIAINQRHILGFLDILLENVIYIECYVTIHLYNEGKIRYYS